MAKVMDCGLVVSDFEPQSFYYVSFQTNTIGKGMNSLKLTVMGRIISLLSSTGMALASNNPQRLICY